jgi:GT2 family glycosyltransferase
MHKVAVVILNWNGRTFLEKFLPSVLNTLPGYAHLVIADNGSEDGSADFIHEAFPDVEFIPLGQNYGFTGGYNRALKQIEATYYVLLNSDIETTPGWVEPIIGLMDENKDIAACQPMILSYHQPAYFEYAGAAGGFIDFLGYPFCRGRLFDSLEENKGQYNDSARVFWATGACMFVRSDDFWKAGGLDEDFFAHMEEIDLCWRFGRMGKKVMCCPKSIVYHVGGGTLPKNNPRKTYLNFRNNIWMLAKNLPAAKVYPVLVLRFLLDQLAAFHFMLKGQFRDAGAVYSAYLALLNRFRRKRNEGRLIPYEQVSPVYKKSILAEYFFMGRRKFSQLKPLAFGRF